MKRSKITELKNNWEDMHLVEPNQFGLPAVNAAYRRFVVYAKHAPFLYIIPAALFAFLVLSGISRFVIVRVASFLQYGY